MAGEEESEVQLIRLALAGEEAAFVALYRRWQAGIYRFILRLSNSASIAEDVTQEVFMALLNGGKGYDPALGSFSSYLYGIAHNHALRRMGRERIFGLFLRNAADVRQGVPEACDAAPDPLGEMTHQERIDALHRAIATLPLRYREVIVLCELQEQPYAEAARAIGCPEGTIRSRLHRARLLLLEKLRDKNKGESLTRGIEPERCLQ